MNKEQELLKLFAAEFETGRLANVKFFVRSGRVSYDELVDEVYAFETANSAPVDFIDRDKATVRFDAPFA